MTYAMVHEICSTIYHIVIWWSVARIFGALSLISMAEASKLISKSDKGN